MAKRSKHLGLNEPLRHPDHRRPVTRREFLSQGFIAGAGLAVAPTVFSLFASPRAAHAALSADLEALRESCGIAVQGAGKIPFLCFDLSGGVNISGSNVLVGGRGGQLDFLTTRKPAPMTLSTRTLGWRFTATARSCEAFSKKSQLQRSAASTAR